MAKTPATGSKIAGATPAKPGVAPAAEVLVENQKAPMDIDDRELFACIAQIPNLSYIDKKTGDKYNWAKIGDVEEMSFGAIKEINRNHPTYVQDLLFIFTDDRLIQHFRLEKRYKDFRFVMDIGSYAAKNIDSLIAAIKSLPTGIKNTVLTRIKALVDIGEIADIRVIRALESVFSTVLL